MNSPLAPHLARFSVFAREVPPPPVLISTRAEPVVTLTERELDARLAAERARATSEAAADFAEQLAQQKAEHDRLSSERLAQARAELAASYGDKLGAELGQGFSALREFMCDQVTAALTPLLAQAVTARVISQVIEALDQLIADPAQPLVTVRGPGDLVAALQRARGAANVAYQISEDTEVTISAEGARVRTRLVAALAALTPEAP